MFGVLYRGRRVERQTLTLFIGGKDTAPSSFNRSLKLDMLLMMIMTDFSNSASDFLL